MSETKSKMDLEWALEIAEEHRIDSNNGTCGSVTSQALVFLADKYTHLNDFWNKQIIKDRREWDDHVESCRVGGTKP